MEKNHRERLLTDEKVNVKVKLALFWTALMFLYIYNDILSFYQPGHVAQLTEGGLEGVVFDQPMLIAAAVLMALPSLMIFISLTVKASVNRIVNIGMGIFHILVLGGTQFIGEDQVWIYWRINEILELLFLLLIIRTAWKWPAEKSETP